MSTVDQIGSDDFDGAPSVGAQARRECLRAFSAVGENEIVTSFGQPIRTNGTNSLKKRQ